VAHALSPLQCALVYEQILTLVVVAVGADTAAATDA